MYRSSPIAAPKLTPEAGIVDDMVRQFADRYAFLRELVQNGIDAGATRIDVRVEHGADGSVRTSVEDDGAGMTRAIIEGPLLTLFESSKESDPTKIGKYGVGFVSVFAIEPERVLVRTRTAHEGWLVTLFGDHSFELSTAPGRGPEREGARTGTEVSLVHTMSGDELAEHAAQARAALLRWCRHAHVPITFGTTSGQGDVPITVINKPLTLPGATSIMVSERDERFVVAIGTVRDDQGHGAERAATFGGFYNRGLTLMESFEPEEGLDGFRFKVDSPRLSHTLSRDSVRRDAELRRVLGRVRDLIDTALWPKLRAQLAHAAEEASLGDATAYLALLEAAQHPRFAGHARRLTIPLVTPFQGKRTMTLAALDIDHGRPIYLADEPSALTQAAVARGWPVVRHVALAPHLRAVARVSVGVAREVLVFATARDLPESPEDRALLDGVVRALAAAGRVAGRARLARFEGAACGEMCRGVRGADDDAIALHAEAFEQMWGKSRAVFFNVEHVNVRLARRRARTDAGLAAHLLARAVLIAHGPLSARIVDRLLASAAPTGRAP